MSIAEKLRELLAGQELLVISLPNGVSRVLEFQPRGTLRKHSLQIRTRTGRIEQ